MTTRPDYPAGGAIDGVEASARPHRFESTAALEPIDLLEGLRARAVAGEQITLSVVELAPGLRMPEHRHLNEQVGLVLRGEFTFTVGGESRLRRPGDMWVIPAGVPHTVEGTGPDGCTVVEAFSPPRHDWEAFPRGTAEPGRWP